jgi:hypothetical protein
MVNKWRNDMETMVINRGILPEPIFSYIKSEKIKVLRENGNVVLSPILKQAKIDEIYGKYSKLSSEEFIKQKTIEKELEN